MHNITQHKNSKVRKTRTNAPFLSTSLAKVYNYSRFFKKSSSTNANFFIKCNAV